MELDSLKELWKSSTPQDVPPKTGDELIALLGRESRHPISRMKQNLKKEFWILTLVYLVVVPYYFFFENGNWRGIAWGYLILFFSSVYYFYRKNRLLNDMACSSCHIRSNLEKQVATLEKYLHFYLYYGTALVGIFCAYCALLLYYKLSSTVPKNILIHSPAHPAWQTVLIWLLLVVVFTGLTFMLQKRWMDKLYVRHVKRLKALLEQMNEAENANAF